MLATKLDEVSLMPEIHTMKRERRNPHISLWPPNKSHGTLLTPCMQNKLMLNKIKKNCPEIQRILEGLSGCNENQAD